MHRLLARQLRRAGGSELEPPERWQDFLRTVSEAYDAADQDRVLLERALDLASDELLTANRSLETAQARLLEAFEQVPAAVALYRGPRHVFTFVNDAWKRLTGRDDSALGRPFDEVFPELQGGPLLEILDKVFDSGVPYTGREMEIPVDRKGTGRPETTFWNFVWQPLQGEVEGEREILLHATDVTDQVRARQAVEQQAARLMRLTGDLAATNDELDQFAYAASHDLRAPLRGIGAVAGWIEQDLGDAMTPEIAEHLRLLRSRVERLDGLIDGLLQYSRAGRTGETVERVDLAELLPGVVELLALEDGQTVDIGPLPVVEGSHAALQLVFQNLISNAFKYGARHVSCLARPADDVWILTVTDDGPGIPEEFHGRIFGLFQRLESRDSIEGAGIGLALVKKILERHDATIGVVSNERSGATFEIRWPARAVIRHRESALQGS